VQDALKRPGRQDDSLDRGDYLDSGTFAVFAALCNLCVKQGRFKARILVSSDNTMGCNFCFAQHSIGALHQKFALTFMNPVLRLLASTVERVGELKTCRSEVDWVIGPKR
jgi:hypothetical protein